MVRALFARRWGLASLCVPALAITMATPAIAVDASPSPGTVEPAAMAGIADLSEPWVATELDGAQAIAGGHGRYVAVGSSGFPAQAAAWASTDGLVWDPAPVADPPVGSAMTDVVATDDGFVAFGVESGVYDGTAERAHAWFSPDGLSWQESVVKGRSKSGLQLALGDLADGPTGQLVLGTFLGRDGGPRLWRTTDGLTWERTKLPTKLPRSDQRSLTGVHSVPQGYLLLGTSLTGESWDWRSADGVTWKRLRDTPLLYDVAVSDTDVLAGVGYSHIYRSPGSLRGWEKAWKRPKSWQVAGANAFEWVGWDGAEFVAVGRDFSTCSPNTDECHRNPLLVSVDGEAWTEAAGPDGLPGADDAVWMTDVASLDDSMVFLGQDHGATTIWTISADAVE